jgi:L-rhamnose isomerase/sugar isomerase
LIYCQLAEKEEEGLEHEIIYMLDQSHNIEPSIEGIIQSVMNTQTAYAKALVVDRPSLKEAQENGDVILSNRIIMEAYEIDVQPLLREVREEMGIDPDPLMAYRKGGYREKIAQERKEQGADTLGGG